jgi:hypothetical protein
MKCKISNFKIAAIILCLIFLSVPYLEAQQHNWYNGYVKAISKGTVAIDDKSYTVDSKVKVVLQTMKKGIISENPTNLTGLRVGDKVSVKLIGDVIKEIIIERY